MFGKDQKIKLAERIGPAVESVGNAATAVIGLSVVALLVAGLALAVALKARGAVTNG